MKRIEFLEAMGLNLVLTVFSYLAILYSVGAFAAQSPGRYFSLLGLLIIPISIYQNVVTIVARLKNIFPGFDAVLLFVLYIIVSGFTSGLSLLALFVLPPSLYERKG